MPLKVFVFSIIIFIHIANICIGSEKEFLQLISVAKCVGEKKYSCKSIQKNFYDEILISAIKDFFNTDKLDFHKYCDSVSNNISHINNSTENFIWKNNYIHINEPDYSELGLFPPLEFRLLGLFNFWNAVNNFHPYKNLFAENGDSLLMTYIPKVISSTDAISFHTTMMEFTAQISDSHRAFISPISDSIYGNYYCPFFGRYINDSLVVVYLYGNVVEDSIDIKLGDVIIAIDNIPIEEKEKNIQSLVSGANRSVIQRNIAHHILKSNDSISTLRMIRQNKEIEIRIKKYHLKQLIYVNTFTKDTIIKTSSKNIIYLNLSQINNSEFKSILTNNKTDKLILDLRYGVNYDIEFNKCLMKKISFKKILYGYSYFPCYSTPTKYYLKPLKKNYQKTNMILIVNEYTQSYSELIAAKLTIYNNIKIIGSTTAGALHDAVFINLPGKISVSFTRSKFISSVLPEIYGNGLKLDYALKEEVSDIKSNQDIYLKVATQLLENGW